MTNPDEPARPRDYALQQELESLREQEREGHSTPEDSAAPKNWSAVCTLTSTGRRYGNAGNRTAPRTARTRSTAPVTATDPPGRVAST